VIPPEDYQNLKDAIATFKAEDKWLDQYEKWWNKYGEEYNALQPVYGERTLLSLADWYGEYYKWLKKYKSGGNPPPPPPPVPPR